MIHRLIEYLKAKQIEPTAILTILSIEYPQYFSLYYNEEHCRVLIDKKVVFKGVNEDGDVIYSTLFSKDEEESSSGNLASSLRKLWQKHVRGRSGNKSDIEMSLAKFKMFNSYSDKDILQAAKYYIDSLDDFKYMSNLESFISKKLLDFLEEPEPTNVHYDKYQ